MSGVGVEEFWGKDDNVRQRFRTHGKFWLGDFRWNEELSSGGLSSQTEIAIMWRLFAALC